MTAAKSRGAEARAAATSKGCRPQKAPGPGRRAVQTKTGPRTAAGRAAAGSGAAQDASGRLSRRVLRRGASSREGARSRPRGCRYPRDRPLLRAIIWSTAVMGRSSNNTVPIVLVRPRAQALWPKALPASIWERAMPSSPADTKRTAWGVGRFPGEVLGETCRCSSRYGFPRRFTSFRHVGVFPEQLAHWSWMRDQVAGSRPASQGSQSFRLYRRRPP